MADTVTSPQAPARPAHGGMKWWGWGDDDVAFTHEDKPELAPFVLRHLSLDVDAHDEPAGPVRGARRPRAGAARAPARGARRRGRAGARVRRRARPRRPRLRQEPARPRAPPARRPRPAARRRRAARRRGRGRRRPADRAGRRRRGHPVRRRHEHLRQPRGAGGRAAARDLARLRAAGPRARHRRRPPASPACRPACFGPHLEEQLNARGWTLGHFPDSFTHSTLGGWIATRSSGMQSDKYGDIADLTRAVRVVTPAGLLVTRPGARARRPGRACARWCSAARAASGSSPRRRCTCTGCPAQRVILGYLFPDWARSLAAMHDIARAATRRRRSRACPTRRRRSSPSPRARRRRRVDRAKSLGAHALTCAGGASFDLERDVPRLHRLRGLGAPRRRPAQGSSARSSPATAACASGAARASSTTRRSSTRRTSATTCSTAARSADVSETSAPWSVLPALYDNVVAAARGAFAATSASRGWIMCHLSHSYHAGACLYFTFAFKPSGRRRRRWRSTASSSRRSSRLHGLGRDALAPPRGRHGARARGSSRTSRRRASRWCARCSTASTPAATSTRARSSDAQAARATARSAGYSAR